MDKSQSLCLYDYLCQKIGSEEVVRVRRITTLICDIGSAGDKRITSGSRGEGLSLKRSDLDLMIIDSRLKVYESEKDIVHQDGIRPLIVDVEDTQPCFTKLRLFDPAVVSSFCKTMLLNDGLYTVFSSELCKSNEEIKYFQQRDPPFSQIQKYGLRRMKREKRFTVLKTLSVMETCFKHQSSIIPRELQLDVTTGPLKCAPVPFAYFLRFLCYYNLHYIPLCIHSLQQLLLTVKSKFRIQPSSYIQTHIFCGIACQMVGESKVGGHFLQTAANFDIFDTSSAKLRLLIEVAYRLICFDRNI
ncbi:unnamed protein product [Mytilus edulis]|uniref:Uncharacterized protein n=1 Tax=Mytilus edulis TaxID=6550 RepID=A0A8S3UZC0_MYTED|nr:unnamed protein product [Mytilus edulis]